MLKPVTDFEVSKIFETIRSAGFLSGYSIALFVRKGSKIVNGDASPWKQASPKELHRIFHRITPSSLSDMLDRAVRRSTPQVTQTSVGLYFFAVPIEGEETQWCIAAGGVRDVNLDLSHVEKLAELNRNQNPIALLDELESLQLSTYDEVAGLAGRTISLVRLLQCDNKPYLRREHGEDRLRMVLDISSELDRAETPADTVSLLCETLGVIFDLPGVLTILPDDMTGAWTMASAWGMLQLDPKELSLEDVGRFFSGRGPLFLPLHEMANLIPSAAGSWGVIMPLAAGKGRFGALLLIKERVGGDELILQELLVGRAALRLSTLMKEAEQVAQKNYAERLTAIFGELALIDSLEELCRAVLDRGVELACARTGSIMLVDMKGEYLSIVSAKGMSPTLAQSLSIRIGSGIAGQVAKNGEPLRVIDVVNDGRFNIGTRPRFKTGAFISLPLAYNGGILGVINLADRKDNLPFSDRDYEVMTALACHAAALIHRAKTNEGARQLELLSITDPLTELYNRRFLERRMEEELARGIRHGLHLSIMILDLDNFKTYNDLFGHPTGDSALQKVAQVLNRSVREMDIVTRYGGEEFCILLPDTPQEEALFVAERIRKSIEEELFVGEEDIPDGRLTVSIGISTFPDNGMTAEELICSADVALYQAKAKGRNLVVVGSDTKSSGKFPIFSRKISLQTQ